MNNDLDKIRETIRQHRQCYGKGYAQLADLCEKLCDEVEELRRPWYQRLWNFLFRTRV